VRGLLKTLGTFLIIIVLLAGWRYLLRSTRPADLKAWENCKAKLLESWAGSHPDQGEPLRHFSADHFYSFGGKSRPDQFDDHDSRGTAVADAKQLGVSEHELTLLDQRIGNECGAFPKS
jgi:hypothetical protein